jgi:hypothetical protein
LPGQNGDTLVEGIADHGSCVLKESTPPKLCHSPNEMIGSSNPLLPQRLYSIAAYRFGEGE